MTCVVTSDRLRTMIKAVAAGMAIVRLGQGSPVGAVKTKVGDGNNTVVTRWDKKSEAAILSCLKETGINVLSEEVGLVTNAPGQQSLMFLVDPLDGSKPFAIGAPTSTLSVALYDTAAQTVIACVVGEPATGRIWFAETGGGTWMFNEYSQPLERTAQVMVWDGSLAAGSVTWLDCCHGFQLAGPPVTPNAAWGRLWSRLNERGIVYGFGTNCGHHALVAHGRGSVAGAITTCRGGPHDIAAGLLVREAGGVTRCFSDKTGQLMEVGPLEVVNANFMISAVSPAVADEYEVIFRECLEAR